MFVYSNIIEDGVMTNSTTQVLTILIQLYPIPDDDDDTASHFRREIHLLIVSSPVIN